MILDPDPQCASQTWNPGSRREQWFLPEIFADFLSLSLYCRFRRVGRRGGAGCCPTTGAWRPAAGPPSERTRPQPSARITPPAWAASGGSWPTGDPDPCQLVIRIPYLPTVDPDPMSVQLVIRILDNWWSGCLPAGDPDPCQVVIRILASWWSGHRTCQLVIRILANWWSGFLANWWSGSLPSGDPDPLPTGDPNPCQLVIRILAKLWPGFLPTGDPCQQVIRIKPQAGFLLSLKLKFCLMF